MRRLAAVRETFKLPAITLRWLLPAGDDWDAAWPRQLATKGVWEAQGLRRWPKVVEERAELSGCVEGIHPRIIYLRADPTQYWNHPQFTVECAVTHEAIHVLQHVAHYDLTDAEAERMAYRFDALFTTIRHRFLALRRRACHRWVHRELWRRNVPFEQRMDVLWSLAA